MSQIDKSNNVDALANQLCRIQVIALEKSNLTNLPSEILNVILWYLITETSHGADPNLLPHKFQSLEHNRRSYYHRIYPVNFEPLMCVNKFFFEFIKKRVFKTVSSQKLEFITHDTLKINKEPFVFNQNQTEKLFGIVPIYYMIYPLNSRVLPHVQTLYLQNYNFKWNVLVGSNWLDGVMETPITNLSKLVVNMKIFENIFVTQREGEPSSYSLSIEEAGDLFAKVEELKFENMPWFLVEQLTHQRSKKWTTDLARYKIQFLFNSLARLVAFQDQPVNCQIYSDKSDLFQLAQILWAFENKSVLDNVSFLQVKLAANTASIPNPLLRLLQNMKKLESLMIVVVVEQTQNNYTENAVASLMNTIRPLSCLEKLTYVGPRLSLVPNLPNSVKYLIIDGDLLFPASMPSFDELLANVVQLDLSFATNQSQEYIGHPRLVKLKNIKSFTARGMVAENMAFIKMFVDVNKSITTLSITLLYKSSAKLQTLLPEMGHIECFNINFTGLSETVSSNPGDSSMFNVDRLLEFIFAHLTSLRVLLFNTLPFSISLHSLVKYLIYQYIYSTKHLDRIYIFGTGQIETFGDTRAIFFRESEPFHCDYLPENVNLSEFCKVESLAPNTSNYGGSFYDYSCLRLCLDVFTMKKLFVSRLQGPAAGA